ncbi:MAG: serine/threonine protein kinase, partial [Proteobacteria bacterium]|nr:serine/threonine protein kinase [Pseudomonadota bacterium]
MWEASAGGLLAEIGREDFGGGRYRLIRVLGSGGMATVYRAYDKVLDIERALKILNEDLAGRDKIRKRFLNEARTMARLRHPNLVSVFDVGVDGNRPYLVMELIRGGDLVQYLTDQGAISPRLAVDVVVAVLGALKVAHDAGVVHRDIKPHNVLVDVDGQPRLTDFGIAQAHQSTMTHTGMVMGTLAYMAPEQKTSARKADSRADIYATGSLLYALVTNSEPHDLWSTELYDEHFANVLPPLAAVIQRATQRKPEQRYQTATDMTAALERVRPELPLPPFGLESLVTITSDDDDAVDRTPTDDLITNPSIVSDSFVSQTYFDESVPHTGVRVAAPDAQAPASVHDAITLLPQDKSPPNFDALVEVGDVEGVFFSEEELLPEKKRRGALWFFLAAITLFALGGLAVSVGVGAFVLDEAMVPVVPDEVEEVVPDEPEANPAEAEAPEAPVHAEPSTRL